jgi:hypothetical protein
MSIIKKAHKTKRKGLSYWPVVSLQRRRRRLGAGRHGYVADTAAAT